MKRYSESFFLFNNHSVISISNLKQHQNSEQNSTKPEVFVMFSKSQGLGSQPKVKVNASFLTIVKLSGNHSPRRQRRQEK